MVQNTAQTSSQADMAQADVPLVNAEVPAAADTAVNGSETAASTLGERMVTAVREILETLVFALLVFLLVQAVFKNFKVEGSSMEPNIHDGQYLIVNRLVYSTAGPVDVLKRATSKMPALRRLLDTLFHAPERGDVIVFIPPNNPQKDYIKRVIGLPGDKVEIRQGRVYVNDRPIIEPYIHTVPGISWGPAVVGPNELFVMGDNRANSSDSRAFGMLGLGNVIGKAWLSYWPPRTWGLVRHYNLGAQLQSTP